MMNTLLQIISRLGAKRTKDNEPHKAKRYIPFPTLEEFMKDPTLALDEMATAHAAAAKGKKVTGTELDEGEKVEGYAFPCKGPGKNLGEQSNRKVFYTWMKMGASLAHQQEMQDALFKKYGDKNKTPTGEAVEDDTEVL